MDRRYKAVRPATSINLAECRFKVSAMSANGVTEHERRLP